MNWLDELDAAAEQATPGPWIDETCRDDECFMSVVSKAKHCEVARSEEYDDTRYIAACSPERIRALIACVRAADALLIAQGDWPETAQYHAARAELDATP